MAPVLIGLTVVAFGTSTPELVVNLAAALRDSTEVGFGNVVGSNIANLGLLLGGAALIAPLTVHRIVVVREIPMMILAAGAAVVLGAGGALDPAGGGYGRGDGLMLLLLFAVFLYYTVGEALRHRGAGSAGTGASPVSPASADAASRMNDPSATRGPEPTGRPPAMGRSSLYVAGGLAGLILGGELTVRGARGIAGALGVPDAVVGLTIVAVGTSLPELATTLTAARKGQGDLAVGNIVGSNIYNLLFIWGVSVTVAPSALPVGGLGDLLVMTGFSLILLPFVVSQRRLSRLEGLFMLLAYAGYVGLLAVRSVS